MRLIIHPGFHKTGTSALQAFCRQNRAILASKGILYPEEGTTEIKFAASPSAEAGHRRLEIILTSPTNRSSRKKLQAVMQEVESYNNVHTLLISSETFSAPKVYISSATLNVLQDYFSEIKVVVYLRRQDDWADSFYREVLCWSRKREQSTFEQFCEGYLPEWLNFDNRLHKWAAVFGDQNMIVKSFDDRKSRNVIVDFFSELGLKDLSENEFSFPTDTNTSLPRDLIPLMLSVNKLELNPRQRSIVTQRIYQELAKSDYRVKRKPLFTQRLKESFRDRYGGVNQELCRRYNIKDCAYFCFEREVPVQAEETSLSPEQSNRIREFAAQLTANDSCSKGSRRNSENKGRVGISCLLNESPEQTKIFVNYHLAIGVSRIRLYFDNPDDSMADYDYGSNKIEIIRCTPEFWQTQAGKKPDTNDDKLYICHEDGLNYLNSLGDIDWAINIDADELLYIDPGTTMQSYLSTISTKYDQVRISPMENIFVSDEDMELFSSRYFKVPRLGFFGRAYRSKNILVRTGMSIVYNLVKAISSFKLLRILLLSFSRKLGVYLIWSKIDDRLYQKYMPKLSGIMREGFLGHRQGRTFTRHGIILDEMSSHVPGSRLRKLKTKWPGDKIFLLHYDAASFQAWYLKWHRRVYGDTTAHVIGGDRQKQQDMFLEAIQQGDDAVKELFYGFFRLPQAAVEKFEQLGLITRLDNPLLDKVKLDLED